MLFSSIAKAKFEYKVFKANKFRVIANNINMQKFQKSQKINKDIWLSRCVSNKIFDSPNFRTSITNIKTLPTK